MRQYFTGSVHVVLPYDGDVEGDKSAAVGNSVRLDTCLWKVRETY